MEDATNIKKKKKKKIVLLNQVTKHGLKHGRLLDRQFMIVNAYTGKFLTARQYPKIVLVQVRKRPH